MHGVAREGGGRVEGKCGHLLYQHPYFINVQNINIQLQHKVFKNITYEIIMIMKS